MNICAKCKHVVKLDQNSPRNNCDYNWLCGAVEIFETVDPVTGRAGYSTKNDLGGFVFHEEKRDAGPTCRSRNPVGECSLFEKAAFTFFGRAKA